MTLISQITPAEIKERLSLSTVLNTMAENAPVYQVVHGGVLCMKQEERKVVIKHLP